MNAKRRAGTRGGAAGPRAVRAVVALAVAAGLVGCARPLLDRAIAARGGPLGASLREVEATVHQGFPGTWTWRIALLEPDLVRWTIHTWGEEQSYVFDGSRVLLFLGSASLPVEPAAAGGFRSQARWLAVTGLDLLRDGRRVEVAEIPRDEVPAGATAGLRVRFRDDGATYRLWFDGRDLLVAAEGEVALPPVGAGPLRADFSGFAPVGGYLLPTAGRYVLAGRPLMEEKVLRWATNPPGLDAAALVAPPR